jgi:hypothetical protein
MVQRFTTSRSRVPGPIGRSPGNGDGRAPGPLGFGPSIILFGDPVPANVVTTRTGTQVLYVRPHEPDPRMLKPDPKKKDEKEVEYRWSIDTGDGRREYETALEKHLKDKKVISGDVSLGQLDHIADLKSVASNKVANLVLIVHGAGNGPAISADLGRQAAGTRPDWTKPDKFAALIAPLGYTSITILGCDSVSNKFTPTLATLLPKGASVTGHEGGSFEITAHFDPDPKHPGILILTRMVSNLKLKTFPTSGNPPNGKNP